MNYLHKSSINPKKNLQLKKNFVSVTNINRNKLSKPLNLIIDKNNKKISQIKIYQGLNTYNEDLDKNTTQSISNISLNSKNNEFHFNKRIKISLSKNATINAANITAPVTNLFILITPYDFKPPNLLFLPWYSKITSHKACLSNSGQCFLGKIISLYAN